MDFILGFFPLILVLFAFMAFKLSVKVVATREKYVIERLGKFSCVLEPGIHFLIPFVDGVRCTHDMREHVIDIPPQKCTTSDNLEVNVDGVVYLKVLDPYKATYGHFNYIQAVVNLAQTTMRSQMGRITLDKSFSEREKINDAVVEEIDKASEPWGVKVLRYEIQNITPRENMIQTMEKQMEAERNKRAEICLSEGQRKSVINLSEGEQKSKILVSEAEKEYKTKIALGKAKEMTLVAEATADGLKRIAQAVQQPGGESAVRIKLIQSFMKDLGLILRKSTVLMVPENSSSLASMAESMKHFLSESKEKR